MENLNYKYNKLHLAVKELYDNNINNPKWSKKLKEEVDYRPLYPDGSYYIEYQENIRSKLIDITQNSLVQDIIDIYSETLDEELENLKLETIGTTLNVIREFYNDLYVGILRSGKMQ